MRTNLLLLPYAYCLGGTFPIPIRVSHHYTNGLEPMSQSRSEYCGVDVENTLRTMLMVILRGKE